jgi:signal transduction histidine kinase
VEDFGTGMSEELQSRIFDPFFTTKEVGKGTGLGLFVVKNQVENLDGRLEIESKLGSGTVFRIRLPSSTAPNS